jgi:hypothetical protein
MNQHKAIPLVKKEVRNVRAEKPLLRMGDWAWLEMQAMCKIPVIC